MKMILVVGCLSMLIAGWLPGKALAANTVNQSSRNPGGEQNDVSAPGAVYTEESLVNVTGAKKQPINTSELAKLKRALSKEGWKAAGKPALSGGTWLLKFVRTVANGIIILPGMYYDKTGQCVRYTSGTPVPGNTCTVQG